MFSKEQMKEVQDDIDKVNAGMVIDIPKLIGVNNVSNEELLQLLNDVYQVLGGFSMDEVWSEWDESVKQRVVEMQQKLKAETG